MKKIEEGRVKRLLLIFIMGIVLSSAVMGEQTYAHHDRDRDRDDDKPKVSSSHVYKGQMIYKNKLQDVYAISPQFTRREMSEIRSIAAFEEELAEKARFTLIDARNGKPTVILDDVELIDDSIYDRLMSELASSNGSISKVITIGLEGSNKRTYYFTVTIDISKKIVVTLTRASVNNDSQPGTPTKPGGKNNTPKAKPVKKITEKKTEKKSKSGKSGSLLNKEGYPDLTFNKFGQMMGVMELDDPLLVASVTPMYADNIQTQDAENNFFPGLSGNLTWLVLLQAAIILLILCVIKRKALKDLLNRNVFNKGE